MVEQIIETPDSFHDNLTDLISRNQWHSLPFNVKLSGEQVENIYNLVNEDDTSIYNVLVEWLDKSVEHWLPDWIATKEFQYEQVVGLIPPDVVNVYKCASDVNDETSEIIHENIHKLLCILHHINAVLEDSSMDEFDDRMFERVIHITNILLSPELFYNKKLDEAMQKSVKELSHHSLLVEVAHSEESVDKHLKQFERYQGIAIDQAIVNQIKKEGKCSSGKLLDLCCNRRPLDLLKHYDIEKKFLSLSSSPDAAKIIPRKLPRKAEIMVLSGQQLVVKSVEKKPPYWLSIDVGYFVLPKDPLYCTLLYKCLKILMYLNFDKYSGSSVGMLENIFLKCSAVMSNIDVMFDVAVASALLTGRMCLSKRFPLSRVPMSSIKMFLLGMKQLESYAPVTNALSTPRELSSATLFVLSMLKRFLVDDDQCEFWQAKAHVSNVFVTLDDSTLQKFTVGIEDKAVSQSIQDVVDSLIPSLAIVAKMSRKDATATIKQHAKPASNSTTPTIPATSNEAQVEAAIAAPATGPAKPIASSSSRPFDTSAMAERCREVSKRAPAADDALIATLPGPKAERALYNLSMSEKMDEARKKERARRETIANKSFVDPDRNMKVVYYDDPATLTDRPAFVRGQSLPAFADDTVLLSPGFTYLEVLFKSVGMFNARGHTKYRGIAGLREVPCRRDNAPNSTPVNNVYEVVGERFTTSTMDKRYRDISDNMMNLHGFLDDIREVEIGDNWRIVFYNVYEKEVVETNDEEDAEPGKTKAVSVSKKKTDPLAMLKPKKFNIVYRPVTELYVMVLEITPIPEVTMTYMKEVYKLNFQTGETVYQEKSDIYQDRVCADIAKAMGVLEELTLKLNQARAAWMEQEATWKKSFPGQAHGIE